MTVIIEIYHQPSTLWKTLDERAKRTLRENYTYKKAGFTSTECHASSSPSNEIHPH